MFMIIILYSIKPPGAPLGFSSTGRSGGLTSPRTPAPSAGPGCAPPAPRCCTCNTRTRGLTPQSPLHQTSTRTTVPACVCVHTHLVTQRPRMRSTVPSEPATYLGGHPFHLSRYSTFPWGGQKHLSLVQHGQSTSFNSLLLHFLKLFEQ